MGEVLLKNPPVRECTLLWIKSQTSKQEWLMWRVNNFLPPEIPITRATKWCSAFEQSDGAAAQFLPGCLPPPSCHPTFLGDEQRTLNARKDNLHWHGNSLTLPSWCAPQATLRSLMYEGHKCSSKYTGLSATPSYTLALEEITTPNTTCYKEGHTHPHAHPHAHTHAYTHTHTHKHTHMQKECMVCPFEFTWHCINVLKFLGLHSKCNGNPSTLRQLHY